MNTKDDLSGIKMGPRQLWPAAGTKRVQILVWCSFEFTACHFWKNAEGKQAYLRHPHRHKFYCKAGKFVTGQDREIEFIAMKEEIQKFIRENYEGKTFEKSCEMIGMELADQFDLAYVEVSEDNENGCLVWIT